MSVHGIHSGVARPPAVLDGTDGARPGGPARAEPQRPAWPVAEVRGPDAAATNAAVPSEAPPGMDPELWSVLTAEERAFVGRLGARGPLTYGRMTQPAQPQAATARGGRLDVRV